MTLPQRFGRYRIHAQIGAGGMGRVYKAHDEKLGRTIALKVLSPEDTHDPEYIARLIREGRLAAGLDDPAIVSVHEVVQEGPALGIAMELVDGDSLERCAKWSPSFEKRIAILESIAAALAHAHSRGVVHRDVKPRNIIVPHEGPVPAKLLDFGIARPLSPQATKVTKEGVILGTPKYMAPEQRLTNEVDARADQYSWAVVAYELLGGTHPKDVKVDGRVAPLAWRCEQLGEARAAVIHRAMSEEPDARFASMLELLAAWRAASHATRTIDVAVTPAVVEPAKPRSRAGVFALAISGTLITATAVAGAIYVVRLRAKPVATIPSPSAAAAPSAPPLAPEASEHEEPPPPAIATSAPPKPRAPRIVAQIDFFQNPGDANRRLHQALPALTACFAGKHVNPGALADVHLKVEPDGSLTDSWSQELCRGPKCRGAAYWLPEGGAKCALKAFQPIKMLGPLVADHTTGAWVNVEVYP